jgi:hypothetical protein
MMTMNGRFGSLACIASMIISAATPCMASAYNGVAAQTATGKEAKNMRAAGLFDVKMTPQAPSPGTEPAKLGRLVLEKHYHGDLAASGIGEMLSVRTEVQGSAGYVALERVTGTLGGRSGSFVLQHSGTMDRGAPSLQLAVVPDSGTGELTGLAGTMTIDVDQGTHRYTMDYVLPAAK